MNETLTFEELAKAIQDNKPLEYYSLGKWHDAAIDGQYTINEVYIAFTNAKYRIAPEYNDVKTFGDLATLILNNVPVEMNDNSEWKLLRTIKNPLDMTINLLRSYWINGYKFRYRV